MEGEARMTMSESKHFQRSELECHCGCGECEMSEHFMAALEKLRTLADMPMVLSCAYRCSKHNAEARGVSKSSHLGGRAADLKIPGLSLQEMYDLAEQVPEFNLGGIGVYDDGFVHVDVRVNRARWARVGNLYTSIKGSELLARW
jgi:uncharacterized protein YcbK (DUF882 family)